MSKSQVVLEIDTAGITAAQLTDSGLRILAYEQLPVAESAIRETLSELCKKLPQDADEYSCSWSTPHMTLIPAGLIGDSKPSELLQLILSNAPDSSETDYNRLMSWNLAAVYHSPSWLKSVLIPKFPRIIIRHEAAHILHQLNTGSSVPTKIVAILHRAYTCFVIRKDGKIVHCSYQQTQTAEDILYHLLYCMKQLQIDGGELVAECTSEETFSTGKKLETIARKIADLHRLKINVNEYEHLKYQRLCV